MQEVVFSPNIFKKNSFYKINILSQRWKNYPQYYSTLYYRVKTGLRVLVLLKWNIDLTA